MKDKNKMATAVTLLTALRMFTNAENTCGGFKTYERYPGYELTGNTDDLIRLNKNPDSVMFSCADQCQLSTTCQSFNFLPGHVTSDSWSESTCYLFRDVPTPDGKLQMSVNHFSSFFTEMCLRSERLTSCQNNTHVFTVHRDVDWSQPFGEKTISVSSRHDCMERCLDETSFQCRSSLWNPNGRKCSLSRDTVQTEKSRNGNMFYMENNCLHDSDHPSSCEGNFAFIKEADVNMRGANIMEKLLTTDLEECTAKCRDDERRLSFKCRSFVFTSSTKECVLYEADAHERGVDLISSATSDLYQLVCLQGDVDQELRTDNTAALYARDSILLDNKVPFQRYRNSRIQADVMKTYRGLDLGRCLDKCLHLTERRCLSVSYSPRSRECQLSGFDQTGSRIVYDSEHDYYENLIDHYQPVADLPQLQPQAPPHLPAVPDPFYPDPSVVFLNVTPIKQTAFLPPLIKTPSSSSEDLFNNSLYPDLYEDNSIDDNILFAKSPKSYYPARGVNGGYDSYDDYRRFSDEHRPVSTHLSGGRRARCDPGSGGGDIFRQVRSRTRLRNQYIRRLETVNSLPECEQECLNERTFKCLSFNYISVGFSPTSEENCELSDKNSHELDIDNPSFYDNSERHDFYQREPGADQTRDARGLPCLDVSQTCDAEGMEFTLRIPEGFWGRIYTHNHYGRSQCFVRGAGGNVYTLRIPGPGSYVDCGTERHGDTLSNVVIVQFSENVQTSHDLAYNMTCTIRQPQDITVTSATLGAGSGQPIPIEYLPAEHNLDSRVRLLIKYQGRPTTTIAVGDPLDFKLETQEGKNLLQDIFATNVIARDPYSDRFVELIDSNGCPVDPYVFPALGLSRAADGLETNFNAFKIPESNFLVFEATVKSCQSGCRPVTCPGPSGRDNSFGRRRREAESEAESVKGIQEEDVTGSSKVELREMFRVYESRDSIPANDASGQLITGVPDEVCVASGTHQALVASLATSCLLLLLTASAAWIVYKKYRNIDLKNRIADGGSDSSSTAYLANSGPFLMSGNGQIGHGKHQQRMYHQQQRYLPPIDVPDKHHNGAKSYRNNFADPSEPIYTDPSLFERSRSIRSIDLQDQIQESAKL